MAVDLPCVPPLSLECIPAAGTVSLFWENGAPYTTIDVLRNGVLIETLPGTTTHLRDAIAGLGTHTYDVVGHCPGGDDGVAQCVVEAVSADATDIVWRGELSSGATDSTQAIVDSLVANGRTPVVVDEIVGLDLSPYGAVWVALGTYPANRQITNAEGQALRDFLVQHPGRGLYVEGADLYAFDPQTELSDVDGVLGTDRGSLAGVVAFLGGLDSGLGLDLSAFDAAPYAGETQFIDHMEAEAGYVAAPVFENLGGAGQFTAVYHDGAATGIGDFRVVASSTEFGGLSDPALRDALMAAYLSVLAPGANPMPQEYQRGDVNSDEMVDLGDALFLLAFGFVAGSPSPPCLATADVDGNLVVSPFADALYLLNFLFVVGSPPPPPPFPDCRFEPTPIPCEVSFCPGGGGGGPPPVGFANFIRGDTDGDGVITLADVTFLFGYISNGEAVLCLDALDVNDDGIVSSSDAADLLSLLFNEIPPIIPPPSSCGTDPTADGLSCSMSGPGCP